MKSLRLIFSGTLFIILLLVFQSCDEDDDVDTTAPTIEITDPVSGEAFEAGDHAHFEGIFTDDIALATFKIDIHNNFDGHDHGGRTAVVAEDPGLIKWAYEESFDIPAGSKNYDAHLHDEIEIPGNTMAGPYHFIVSAIDQSGNATSFQDGSTKEIEVFITNDSQPMVDITNLENDELEIEEGVVFMVEGTISDPVPATGDYAGMHGLQILLGEPEEHGEEHTHNGRIADEHLIEKAYDHEAFESFMDGENIILENIFADINFTLSEQQHTELEEEEIDHLELTIRVEDEQGNITVSKTEVHVHHE